MKIENKVAKSGLVTIEMEQFMPFEQCLDFDLKSFLYKEYALKETAFREAIANFDFSGFANKIVGVFCSNDALIPTWAYMLVAAKLTQIGAKVHYGNATQAAIAEMNKKIEAFDFDNFRDAKVILKGCSKIKVHETCYIGLTAKLLPIVRTLMFGEPCSTVPVYKKQKEKTIID